MIQGFFCPYSKIKGVSTFVLDGKLYVDPVQLEIFKLENEQLSFSFLKKLLLLRLVEQI